MMRLSSACVTDTGVAVKLSTSVCASVLAASVYEPVSFSPFAGSTVTVYCVPGTSESNVMSSPEM